MNYTTVNRARVSNTKVHIYAPQPTRAEKRRRRCPFCGKRTTQVAFFVDWYGWDTTCLRCGDRWQDGEMMPRPFAPGWRRRSIEAARRRWKRYENPTEQRERDQRQIAADMKQSFVAALLDPATYEKPKEDET